MKIMKFGGTSVGKPERMLQVKDLITRDNQPKIVVLSALSGTTNTLVEINKKMMESKPQAALELIKNLHKQYTDFIATLLTTSTAKEAAQKIIDTHFHFIEKLTKTPFSPEIEKTVLAQGELMSTQLFSHLLIEKSIPHRLINALDFMYLDENEEPRIDLIQSKLSEIIADKSKNDAFHLFITQGYICRNHNEKIDNLKRGGSDYTASLIAAATKADVCEIWTDIDGMHNNDPRIVNKTMPVEELSFEEAAELAYFGAKILHPTCIWPAQQYDVPVKLLNTMEPLAKGTTIHGNIKQTGIKAVAAKDGITAIKIKSSRMLLAYGFLRKVFEIFEKYKTAIDMITTSEVAVSVTVDNDKNIPEILKELAALGSVEILTNQAIVAIVGDHIAHTPDVLAKLFEGLKNVEISMVSYGGSLNNISLLIPAKDKQITLQKINKTLFGL